ncbi:10921_t:CDS:2, partial [Gigaspora margarita]
LCGRSRGIKSLGVGRLALGNHDDGKAPHNHEASSGHENPKESSNILAERNRNILEKDSQKDEVKGVKTDGQKKKNKSIKENFKNKVFIEKSLTGNTFHN